MFSGYDLSTTGNQTVSVSYTEGGVEKTTSYAITVGARTLVSIALTGNIKTTFTVGETFSFGGVVTATYDNTTQKVVTNDVTFSGNDTSTAGQKTVTVTYIEGGETATAQYTITVSAQQQENITATVSISDYASSHSWTNETAYYTVEIDEHITATASSGGNTGKYYTNGNNWRFYQSSSSTLTITADSGYTIQTITITYSSSGNGKLVYGGNNINSGDAVSIGASSAVFSVGATSGTSGQARITQIVVVYRANT